MLSVIEKVTQAYLFFKKFLWYWNGNRIPTYISDTYISLFITITTSFSLDYFEVWIRLMSHFNNTTSYESESTFSFLSDSSNAWFVFFPHICLLFYICFLLKISLFSYVDVLKMFFLIIFIQFIKFFISSGIYFGTITYL